MSEDNGQPELPQSAIDFQDQQLRLSALAHAASLRDHPHEVLDAARLYYAFLKGGA